MAQKEAVNTFTGGMVMDTHPLTTPNNVLTNCLNGTLVTFNGNEMILQNDLGNAKIESKKNGDCIKLPEGFVPVGTAELGGIIYVASFNPEENMCELGCFPSPERNETSSEQGLNGDFQYNDLIQESGTIILEVKPLIKGSIRIDLTNKELHSGDEYKIILPNSLSDKCEFKLISVSEDGNIMDLDYHADLGENDYDYYRASNSGKLAMLISPKKLNSFSCTYSNLVRKGNYNTTEESDETKFTNIYQQTLPDKYQGDYIKLYEYIYYKLEGNEFVIDSNVENESNYIELSKEQYGEDTVLRDSSGRDYKYIQESETFVTGEWEANEGIEDKTIIRLTETNKFKVLSDPKKYEWTDSGWDVNVNCTWNDKNKEEEKYSTLSKILIPSTNQIYSITSSDNASSNCTISLTNIQPEQNDTKLKLKLYPVIEVSSGTEGYIEELVQEIIIDPSLKEGQIKLVLWKYYYDNNTINLAYGFTGQLKENQEITSIIVTAIEYESKKEQQLIKLDNRSSYLGTFYEQIELGKTLLTDKLYAIKIEINSTDYPTQYEYRWLYTNDIFNDKFNSSIEDFNECYIPLNKLVVDLNISDNDSAFHQGEENKIKSDFNPIVKKVEDIGLEDYAAYGYTRTEFDNEIPYTFDYSIKNKLFNNLDSRQFKSNILSIKSGDLESPYNETDSDRLVLNSYKGQANDSEPSTAIYDSRYAYKNYTDYIGIDEYGVDEQKNTIKFVGRLYNKIKATIGTCNVNGGYVYAPLVYDKTTARKYNLEYVNGQILPIYYLCMEVLPYLEFHDPGGLFTSSGFSEIYGRLSLYKVKIQEKDGVRKLIRSLGYDTIASEYECWFHTANESHNLNLNNITNAGSKLILQEVVKDLESQGITNCSIIPVVFTSLRGFRDEITEFGGSSDYYKDVYHPFTFFDYPNSNSCKAIIYSRNRDNKTIQEFTITNIVDSDYTLNLPSSIAFLSKNEIKIGNTIAYLDDNTVDLDLYSNELFQILSQIYVRTEALPDAVFYYVKDYDWQQDYVAKLNLSGIIETTSNIQRLITEDNAFSNWNQNNLYLEDGTLRTDFKSYKCFYADQNLINQYKLQTESYVKNTYDGSQVKGYLKDKIDVSGLGNSEFYLLKKTNNTFSLETPNNGEIKLNCSVTISNINPDNSFEYNIQSLSNVKTYSNLNFDLNEEKFETNKSTLSENRKLIFNEHVDPNDLTLNCETLGIQNEINGGL